MNGGRRVELLPGRLPAPGLRAPPDDGKVRAAVAVVLHGDDPYVLLMKRVERPSDPWSGHVSLPGGRHEPQDPHLLATAIRETREELGVELADARLLGQLPTMHPQNSGPRGVEVTPFVFGVPTAPPVTPNAEAESGFWLSLVEAASGRLDGSYVYPTSQIVFPTWEHGGHRIWGLTMRILADLIGHLDLRP